MHGAPTPVADDARDAEGCRLHCHPRGGESQHPAPSTVILSRAVGQCCPDRDCLGSCYVRVYSLQVLEMAWGGGGSGGPQCGCMHGGAWQYEVQLAENPRAKLAFGSCTRRSKKEPPMVTVFCNGKKGKKLARSCVCSSDRVGFPRGASAAHGTVLGFPAMSIVLVLRVGDVHDGHQSLLGAEAAL